jgi:hypothetical protein
MQQAMVGWRERRKQGGRVGAALLPWCVFWVCAWRCARICSDTSSEFIDKQTLARVAVPVRQAHMQWYEMTLYWRANDKWSTGDAGALLRDVCNRSICAGMKSQEEDQDTTNGEHFFHRANISVIPASESNTVSVPPGNARLHVLWHLHIW